MNTQTTAVRNEVKAIKAQATKLAKLAEQTLARIRKSKNVSQTLANAKVKGQFATLEGNLFRAVQSTTNAINGLEAAQAVVAPVAKAPKISEPVETKSSSSVLAGC